jgi:hypothetical protein
MPRKAVQRFFTSDDETLLNRSEAIPRINYDQDRNVASFSTGITASNYFAGAIFEALAQHDPHMEMLSSRVLFISSRHRIKDL